MTASFGPSPAPARHGPSPLAAVVVGIAGVVGAITLTLAGFTFVGLAIAFPIAVPVALNHGLVVSAGDIDLARGFAQFAWVFAALAVVSFTGAVAVLVAVVRAVFPTPRD